MNITISTDTDGMKYLVALDPDEQPEGWDVAFISADGTIETLPGESYCQFPSLWHRPRATELYAWDLPRGSGTIRLTAPGSSTTEMNWSGR